MPDRLPPGSTIGILGGGQLGRMLALAAGELGMHCHIYCPDPHSPAFDVAAATTVAAYDDAEALDAFADAVDVVTYEFENVPASAAARLAGRAPLFPDARALEVSQDRLHEKRYLAGLGIGVAPFRAVDGPGDLAAAMDELAAPAILKTRRLGYDGKGQTRVAPDTAADEAWQAIGAAPAIVEAVVDFDCEISLVAARARDGAVRCFDPARNEHVNHILARSHVPAGVDAEIAGRAGDIAENILSGLDYIGVIGIEMFVVADTVLVNEIAPRVHNSGHWTSDACVTGQFEQHIRAILGWPLGDPRRHADVVMTNLIGDDVARWSALAERDDHKLHIYGKRETRAGRKMGHVTRLLPLSKG